MKYSFGKDFLFGASASGPQTEGAADIDGRSESSWDRFYKVSPERFFNKVGPDPASDVYNRYKDDIALMKKIGLNSYRTSIQWTRFMPDGKNVNPKAAAFYSDMLDELIDNGIVPMINLYHFDMPMWLEEKGGLTSFDFIDSFALYAEKVFEHFGDRCKRFTTFNEPIVPVHCNYLYGGHYPEYRDMKKAVQAAYNTQIASARAVEIYRKMRLDGQIGIILNLTPTYTKDDSAENVKAAYIADLMENRVFLDPSVLGHYPKELVQLMKDIDRMPERYPDDLRILADNTVDFLGVNYYYPRRVVARSTPFEGEVMPEAFFENYDMPGAKMNIYRGWEIYEKGIYDIAINIRDNYRNLPWYVSENGMGVENEERFINEKGWIDDDYRIEFQKDHLRYLHKGIAEGANCFGYHNWAFVDNWSWSNAYKNRYGFVALDLETQKRTLKKSAYFISDVIKNRGFED